MILKRKLPSRTRRNIPRLDYSNATHCPVGHDLTAPDALTIYATGRKACTACRRKRDREAKAARALARRGMSPNRPCVVCGKSFAPTWEASHCSEACLSATRKASGAKSRKARHKAQRERDDANTMSAGEVERRLSYDVWLETQPPWVRHPVAQTGVVLRR